MLRVRDAATIQAHGQVGLVSALSSRDRVLALIVASKKNRGTRLTEASISTNKAPQIPRTLQVTHVHLENTEASRTSATVHEIWSNKDIEQVRSSWTLVLTNRSWILYSNAHWPVPRLYLGTYSSRQTFVWYICTCTQLTSLQINNLVRNFFARVGWHNAEWDRDSLVEKCFNDCDAKWEKKPCCSIQHLDLLNWHLMHMKL